LSNRLETAARLGAEWISPDLAISLSEGYLSAYDSTLDIIGKIKQAGSFSEVFIINPDYRYLATTLSEADSFYYLSALNGVYIDSVFSLNAYDPDPVAGGRVLVTDGYPVGDIVLKSVFAPVFDTSDYPVAVIGVEADVDYTEALVDLRNNLYLSTAISVSAGLLFGFFFFLVQRRINITERNLFMSQSQANLGRMVAVVSHEIKNPLMIIRGSAERLKRSGMTEADFIIEETDRLNNIVSGYLDFARGKKIVRLEPVNTAELMKKIVDQFSSRLEQDGVSISLREEGLKKITVLADPVALRQVLINLILNGADAVRGKPEARVELRCHKVENRVVISIKDNGEGMNPGKVSSIFEPFYTTKTTGSGLGLFHSRALVRQMNGDIRAESRKGGPTIFKIILDEADKGK